MALIVAGLVVSACHETKQDAAARLSIREDAAALTETQARVLGFETPTADWSAASGTVASSSSATQGSSALAVAPSGWTEIDSIPLSSLSGVRSTLSLDVLVPGPVGWGEIRVIFKAPSLDMNWVELGQHQLSSLPTGAYTTVSFSIPADTVTALSGSYSDFQIKLVVNGPTLGTPYLIDNIVMTDSGGTIPPGGGTAGAFSIMIPEAVTVDETFMSATSHLKIFSQAQAEEPDGFLPAIASFGTEPTLLQSEAKAFTRIFSVPTVALEAKTHVEGNITTEGIIDKQGVGTDDEPNVVGNEYPGAPVPGYAISWDVSWPAPTGDVVLWAVPESESPRDTIVGPGAYGEFNVHDRNRVYLSAGTYYFNTFNLEPQAEVYLDKTAGPIYIYVKENLPWTGGGAGLKGKFLENGGEAGQTLFGFLGTGDVFVQGPFVGTIVAPNAVVKLERPTSGQHKGAFFGRGIEVAAGLHTVLHIPFDYWIEDSCPYGDSDGDTVNDCEDGCITDPNKTTPGLCNCGVPDVDSDGDGVPDCRESSGCELDPGLTAPGQCGGCGTPNQPAGKPCTDGPCSSTEETVCDGAGHCGDPAACLPESSCYVTTFGSSRYWFCTGPTTRDDANAYCTAQPNRYLVRIDTRLENDFVAGAVGGAAWIGANDLSLGGAWNWSNDVGNDGGLFWTGSAGGTRISPEVFEAWADGQPSASGDCGRVESGSGQWIADDCSAAIGYVCEAPDGFSPPDIPPPVCSDFFPARICDPTPEESPDCQPADVVLPDSDTETYEQIENCEQAVADGLCSESVPGSCDTYCVGAASVPDPDATCPPFDNEERAHCELTDIQNAGCTAGEDCCWVSIDRSWNIFESDPDGFTYSDDAFLGTGEPSYADGQFTMLAGNGVLEVTLGGQDGATVQNMSGGWSRTFTMAAEALVSVEFYYNLNQSADYEADEISQVLLSIDGELKGVPLGNVVAQIVGDGDGGSPISTGWILFERNLGVLSAGTHEVTIGAFNSRKTDANEVTTLYIDNVNIDVHNSSCDAGYICAPVYPPECPDCDTTDPDGFCPANCDGVLRCGRPFGQFDSDNDLAACADDTVFDNDRCEVVEICAAPEADGDADPLGHPDSNLDEEVFDPQTVFGDRTDEEQETYIDDPACAAPPCCIDPPCEEHRWCSYNVNLWEDPVVGGGLGNPLPVKSVPADSKEGTAGSSILSFSFDPGVSLDYNVDPGAFGENGFNLDTAAWFRAGVNFDLPPAVNDAHITLVDGRLGVHADRCHFNSAGSHLTILGTDFLPDSASFDESDFGFDATACEDAVAAYENAVDRARKAYSDALELIRQYNQRLDAGVGFPADFCESIVADAPAGFPDHPCAGESSAATVNRFIAFYRSRVGLIQPALNALSAFTFPEQYVPIAQAVTRETQLILEAFFPLGPIPMLLEVEAFLEYGLEGGATFTMNPTSLLATGEVEELAFAQGHLSPYAIAGAAFFVGAGFGVNGFKVSAGVEGAITLGRLSMDNYAGAGIGVQAVPDERPLPDAIAAAGIPEQVASKATLFPLGGPQTYNYSLLYKYGSALTISDMMRGTLAGRIRLKIAFFSKTWRRVLLRFPGLGTVLNLPLLTGGDNAAATLPLGHEWGGIQMPLPFMDLTDLSDESLPPSAEPIDQSLVGDLFYDGMCECAMVGDECSRDAHCCDHPTTRCFSDPMRPYTPTCQGCRMGNETCNDTGDCCDPMATCYDRPGDGLPPGVKVCSCSMLQTPCESWRNCCNVYEGTGPARLCQDDPLDGLGDVPVCRRCAREGESCFTTEDCCPEIVGRDCNGGVCEANPPT
jgi:hypothetical protein